MFGRRKNRRRSRKDRVADSADVGCCVVELVACTTLSTTLVTATAAGYRATPPISGGPRSARPFLRAIRSYQREVSAHRPAVCTLEPTCSHYGYAVLQARGIVGLVDVARRLRECAALARGNRMP